MQHCFATITKTWCLHRNALECAANLVDHQRCQCFTFDIFSNDDQLLARLHYLFEHRNQVAHVGYFARVQQDVAIINNCFHAVGVGDEIWRDVTLVETHSFNEVHFHAKGLALFNGDHSVFAHLVDGFRNHLADFFIGCRNGCHLSNL